MIDEDNDTPSPDKSRDHSGRGSGTNTPATSIEDGEGSSVRAKGGAKRRMDSPEDGIKVLIDASQPKHAATLAKRRRAIVATATHTTATTEPDSGDSKGSKAPVKREEDSMDRDDPPAWLSEPVVHLGTAAIEAPLPSSKVEGGETSAISSRGRNKGKQRAHPVKSEIDLADYTMDTDDEWEAALSLAANTVKRVDDSENDDPYESPIEDSDSDFDDGPPLSRRRIRNRRTSVTSLSTLSSDEEISSDESLDVPLAQQASSSAVAHGSMQEETQYETAKQREKRLKREAREAKANERARRTGKARKVKKKTQYQKNKDTLIAHHPELIGVWETLKATPSQSPEKASQPVGLSINLLPFQLEGLSWLIKQEKSSWMGGALADEMGMGKTIQIISLLLSDRKKPNLVVAPTVAILQWRNEVDKYTTGFKVVVWHGANRSSDTTELQKADVVLVSYGVLESAFRKQVQGFKRKGNIVKEKSAIHQIKWHRIVLDEAHNIKERATNTAKGAFELKGTYRWCLSGTPLQNRVGELYSMIRFLGGDPFSYYYCKRCPCKSLHWQFSDRRHCDKCGHTPMHHLCLWNNEILKPIQKFGTVEGEGRDAFERLRLLLDRMMLRRTKLERADDMGLPPRTVEVRRDMFNEEEEDLYESLYSDTTRKFSTYLDQGTVLNNYSNIFTLLTRMRQLACHPDLVLRSKTGISNKLLGDETGAIHVCRICQDEAEDAIMSRCRHVFCRECVRQWVGDGLVEDGEAVPECPYCHATLTIDLEGEALEPLRGGQVQGRQGILSRLDMNKWRSSTKIEALLEELNQLKSEDKTIKSLVFSQFVNFLDLIAFRLTRAGFQICRLEGNMSPEARNKTINHFMNNPGVTVFLVSLKAGGVALNLTEASRVFLMDPWWNPSVEVQAMDRIHRLGQHRPIVVKRMIVENSIESRIIELQNKKSAMIEAAIGKDDSAMGRLSVSDLSFLFSL